MSRLPLRMAFFTSPIALVMRISRGQASVQLKMVRQRHPFSVVQNVQALARHRVARAVD